jgi:hypothetical protein
MFAPPPNVIEIHLHEKYVRWTQRLSFECVTPKQQLPSEHPTRVGLCAQEALAMSMKGNRLTLLLEGLASTCAGSSASPHPYPFLHGACFVAPVGSRPLKFMT